MALSFSFALNGNAANIGNFNFINDSKVRLVIFFHSTFDINLTPCTKILKPVLKFVQKYWRVIHLPLLFQNSAQPKPQAT